jgi:hypothetical protein
MVKFINLTPHTIYLNDGRKFEPSGQIARVSNQFKEVDLVDDVIIYEVTYGDIEGLPEPEEGKLFIVSAMVLEAGRKIGRNDLVAPATGHPEAIRNEQGQIVSVPGFIM